VAGSPAFRGQGSTWGGSRGQFERNRSWKAPRSPAARGGSCARISLRYAPDRDEKHGRASRTLAVFPRVRVEFIGSEAKLLVREYTSTTGESAGDAREFTLTILNETFQNQRER
jgi:hypothetical protein